MMSVNMKKVHEIAEKYDKNLKATDFSGSSIVAVHSLVDMSSFIFSEAFAMSYKDYYIVFTEHYGFHIYHEDEHSVVMYKREGINELKIEV